MVCATPACVLSAVPGRGRCRFHLAQRRAAYGGVWPTISREAIALHVQQNGWRCLGDEHHAAHASSDLVADHVTAGTLVDGIAVTCRAANSARANRARGSA